MPDGRFRRPQLLELMLCEIADAQTPAFETMPRKRLELARKKLHQRRFAGAIRAEQSNAISGPEREVDPIEHSLLRVSRFDTLQRKQRIRCARRFGEFKIERRIDVRGRNALHAVERFKAALRLARFGGLRAEPLDETREVGYLPLLFLEERLLRRKLAGPLLFERAVIAGIEREPLRADMRDLRDAAGGKKG